MDIGIHRSVEQVFPPSRLCDRLSDLGDPVVVPDDRPLTDCDVLVTFSYDRSFLDAGVRWIHCVRAGVDEFPQDELVANGVLLTNSTGLHGDVVGETVVGYMTSLARRLHVHRTNQGERRWEFPEWDEPFTLAGESVTVVGLGTLGRGVASRADCLGMSVTGVRRTPAPVDHVDAVYTPADLTEAIADARFVVLAVPLTDETEALVGDDELRAMRSDAYLVNVARGPIVDQEALVAALRSEEIAGAALDVFEEEPLPPDSPLWEMDDVIVTPHAAAASREYPRRVEALVRENYDRITRGTPLVNEVV